MLQFNWGKCSFRFLGRITFQRNSAYDRAGLRCRGPGSQNWWCPNFSQILSGKTKRKPKKKKSKSKIWTFLCASWMRRFQWFFFDILSRGRAPISPRNMSLKGALKKIPGNVKSGMAGQREWLPLSERIDEPTSEQILRYYFFFIVEFRSKQWFCKIAILSWPRWQNLKC